MPSVRLPGGHIRVEFEGATSWIESFRESEEDEDEKDYDDEDYESEEDDLD